MGGDRGLGDGVDIVAAAEAGDLVRGYHPGRTGKRDMDGIPRMSKGVTGSGGGGSNRVEMDSSCFPFVIDEIEVKSRDVGGSFGYQANYISNRSERRKGYGT